MAAINSLPLLSPEEIRRRLSRMRGEHHIRRNNEITFNDLARWVQVDNRRIRLHANGKDPISDMWQLIYTQFFAMVDSGELVIQWVGDPNDRRTMKKMLVRVPKPAQPPKPPIRPRIDFAEVAPRLKFE